MSDPPKVAIFWDYENCSPPSNSCGLGYDIVNNIRCIARPFGSVTTFRAYLDISAQSPKSVVLRSELQSSGVSMIDCPHNGKKDVVDKMILVDMLAFAIDHPTPATVILITGDRDYAYAVSVLKLRKYHVILVLPSSPHVSPCLESQASLVIDWAAAVLKNRTETSSVPAVRQPYPDLDPSIVAKLLGELQDPLTDDSISSQSASRLRRISARDLLESTRHSKATGSIDATHEGTSASSASVLHDSAPEGSPIPRTPSRSRRASVSVASTRAHSATIATPPPTLEHQPPLKNPPLAGAGDNTVVASPVNGSLSALPPLDAFESPLHDNPLGGVPVTEKACTVPPRGLNYLASPFVTTKAPIGSGSACAVKSASPIVALTKALPDTAYETLKAVPSPSSEHDDASSEWSSPYRVRPKTTDTPKSNHRPYFASPTMNSPLNRGAGPRPLDDTPSGKLVSPPVMFLGVVDDDDDDSPESPPSSRASSALGHSASDSVSTYASGGVPSDPFTTGRADESERRRQWTMFEPLIQLLSEAQMKGIARSSRSTVALELLRIERQAYQRAGVLRFRDYTALAEQAGVIQLGGREAEAWIALQPNWFGGDATTAQSFSSRVSSPTSEPPVAIQNPPLMSFKSPLIDWATSVRPPIVPSPRPGPPESGIPSQILAYDWQDGAVRTVPVQFQPLIDHLVRMHAEGSPQALRSIVGQSLGQDVYVRAGVPGFREYVNQASQARLVQCGGVGGHAWIRLHPELRT